MVAQNPSGKGGGGGRVGGGGNAKEKTTDKAREFDLFGLNKYSMRTFSLLTAYNRFPYPDVYLLSLNPWRCVENKSLHT